jgi:hypothetical protein
MAGYFVANYTITNQAGYKEYLACQWPSCGPRWWPVKSPHPSG